MPTPSVTPGRYSIGQVASALNISLPDVEHWIRQRKLSVAMTTPGGHRRFDVADVDALGDFLDAQRVKR